MLGCKPRNTPIELGDDTKMHEREPIDKEIYQHFAGKKTSTSRTLVLI